MGYSVEKLRLFYSLAQSRCVRGDAQFDLRWLRILRCAVASVMDKQGLSHYKKSEEALLRVCNFDPNAPQDQKGNLDKVAARLTKMGARKAYGRVS